MADRVFNDGELIQFKSPIDENVIIEGKMRGIATSGMPILGRGLIVETIGDPFPDYGFSCIVVNECAIVDLIK